MEDDNELNKLSGEVKNLSDTIVGVADGASNNQVYFKKFLQVERKELSRSIEDAAATLDRSSKASFWLSIAIAFFAFVEAGSIFYDAFFKST